jgi:AbrB family looped-hinge helix DNA binding protein
MATVTISPKFQVVIPKAVREKLNLRPGQQIEAFAVGGRIELVPVEPVGALRGRFAGLPPFERDPDRL